MNKREFLQRLRDNLTQMPEEEVNAALRYYEEYFDEAGAQNEERVLNELGSPEQVAKQILADGRIKDDRQDNKIKQSRLPIWIAVGVVLCMIVLASIFNRQDNRDTMVSNGVPITSQQSKSGYVDIEKVVEPFKNIDVEVDMMEVSIMQGEEYKVKIHYLASNEMSYEVKNDTLTCVQKNTTEVKNMRNSMTIYVPKNIELSQLNIKSGMGDSILEKLKAGDLIVTSGMGDVKLSEMSCNTVDVELGMGDAKVEGTVNGDINIDNGMGDVKLDLTGKRQDYNYAIDRGMGSVKIDGTKHEGMGEVKEDNNASNTITVSNGMGDTKIEFK